MCLMYVELYWCELIFFFLMIRRPPRSTQSRSSAASDVYKRQVEYSDLGSLFIRKVVDKANAEIGDVVTYRLTVRSLSLIHISEPTRPY